MIKDIIKTDNVIRCTIGLKGIGEVRVLCEDGLVFFCAKDVCRAFNIQDYRTCVNKYCKSVQRFYHMTDVGIRKMNFVNFTDIMQIFEHSNLSYAGDLLFEYAIIVDAFHQANKKAEDLNTVADIIAELEIEKEKVADNNNIDDEYDYCSDCEHFDDCYCDGDCDNCDERFVCESDSNPNTVYQESKEPEEKENKTVMFNIFDLLHKLNEGIAAIENEFGVVVIIEGVYSEYPDGERHRIA
ncbi:MAG: hypothetical protein U0M02_05570 [Acutalibacteraceae bacterium]|nr:hypothetical protein [Acutalibacteraceae bacterium]